MTFEQLWNRQQYTDDPDDLEFAKTFYYQGKAEIESLRQQVAEQKETIASLESTIKSCDELSRLARIKRDEQAELIEKLVWCLENHQGNYKLTKAECVPIELAMKQYKLWKEKQQCK